jgi:dihydrolipoamide dehydrogenase
LLRDAEQFDDYGLVGDAPRLDFPELMGVVRRTVEKLHDKKQLADHLAEAGVSVYVGVGEARFVDEHTLALGASGRTLEGQAFILCAGGRARRLDFPGSALAWTHSDLWALEALPKSIAVIGGAATGCQLASIFATWGTRVSILERGGRLLKREDRLLSEEMGNAFRRRGIETIFHSQRIEGIERGPDDLQLTYLLDDMPRHLEVEGVFMAVGWPSNADTLNLAAVNVATDRGYVVVDQYLRTTVPHIFAAGDVNGQMMLVQSASFEGRIAAENAVLGVGQRYGHHVVPHGGFTDPEYASVGLTEEQARAVEPDCLVSVVDYEDLDRAVIDNHTVGFCKLVVSQTSHRILGAHIVGEDALEVVQLVAAGMATDMWVEQLAELELAYPTYTAIVGLAARKAVRALGVMPMASTWQTLGRPHAAEWERSVL